MVVGEPPQQGGRLMGVLPVEGRRLGIDLLGDGERALAHGRPVLHRGPHVAQDADDVSAQIVQHLGVGLPICLQVDERLGRRPRRRIVTVEDLDQPPRVATHREDGVHGEVQSETVPDDLVRHRVDDERHVVAHDVDDRVRRTEAVLLEVRGVHPHRGCPRRSVEGQGEVRHRGAVQVVHGPGREVGAGDAGVVLPDERQEQPLLLRG